MSEQIEQPSEASINAVTTEKKVLGKCTIFVQWSNISKSLNQFKLKEVASITLRNAHNENKRTKSECSFTLFCFLNYR